MTLVKPYSLKSFNLSDSNYSTNAEDRRSVSGYIATIGGMISGWKSKTQSVVTLSSTEEEYVALTLCVQESKFQYNLLNELSINEGKEVVYEDNMGTIFLSENEQVSARTKHIDIRYHFIRDIIHKKELKVKHVKGENNVSDILTKNVNQVAFNKHSSNIKHGNVLFFEGEC